MPSETNMARTPLIRTPHQPYHITCRSNNKEWFYLPVAEFWEILLEIFCRPEVHSELKVHALVLMSNHFHLLASSTTGSLDRAMCYLLREVCREVNRRTSRINHLFGGPYKWSLINNTSYYLHCLKYIYRNPVAAGLVDCVQDYAFSSIHAHRNPSALPFAIYPWKWAGDWLKWGDYQSILNWLNTPYPHDLGDYIRTASRYAHFRIPRNRNTRKVPSFFGQDLSEMYRIAPYSFDEIRSDYQK